MKTLLQIKGIDTFYDKNQILHEICLDLFPGEKILLIGPNGAGKTTLLKTIIGLIPHQNGHIYYQGKDFSTASVQARVERGIGYLLQTGNIVPGLTVNENLDLGGFYLSREDLQRRKEMVLNSMKFLKPKLNLRAGLLSGGERQTVALSMVLMRTPSLLLLDEPSAGLSPKTANEIVNNLDNIQSVFDVKTVFMVEHNLKLALQWATKVVILVQGRIVLISEKPEYFIQKPEEVAKYFFK